MHWESAYERWPMVVITRHSQDETSNQIESVVKVVMTKWRSSQVKSGSGASAKSDRQVNERLNASKMPERHWNDRPYSRLGSAQYLRPLQLGVRNEQVEPEIMTSCLISLARVNELFENTFQTDANDNRQFFINASNWSKSSNKSFFAHLSFALLMILR
jgi:hypothetical protein